MQIETNITPHEIRLASFNVRNLALPGLVYYENKPPYSIAEYDMKTTWIAGQLDQSNADVIGLQEIFSPESLADILAKTRHYRNAKHITVESHSSNLPKSPNVALISRLPIVCSPVFHTLLPDNLAVTLPGDNMVIDHFSRPVLHACIRFPNKTDVHILLAHLKSKKPDYPENANPATPLMSELGSLRSLIRRGTDALGIRHLVSNLRNINQTPLIVMGDFNDFAFAASTQIIIGESETIGAPSPNRLYNCFEIQSGISYDEKNSLFFPGTDIPRIDHILVSKEFTAQSGFKLGKVRNVRYFNHHLGKDRPEISDHGLVMATIQLK
ncbi:MAG: endonuclease/exonuclease/phosphatase family protein [Betaproteobacteria bacterium]|nr:endonuclease/exonuclease/phosphatase family protein [Betaproteobacteria bacterium]